MKEADKRLIESARRVIGRLYQEGYHHVAAALRTKKGKEYCAVHLEANVGRISVCAEAITIGMAAADGDTDIDTIVAVDKSGDVVSPCGMCRELISDYAAEAKIIVPWKGGEKVVSVSKLLPNKYRQTE